jgi:hypothetical protein
VQVDSVGNLTVDGEPIDFEAMVIPRAKALVAHLAKAIPYSNLLECRRTAGTDAETIVFDVEIERGQRPVWPIQHTERVATTFRADDGWYPEVLALRDDFPWTPHQFLRATDHPRSLCLYDQTWDEEKIRWTPTRFVERIRWWMAMTAAGRLHQEDQPLEPFILGTGNYIVLPAGLFANKSQAIPQHLLVTLRGNHTFIAHRADDPMRPRDGGKFVAIAIECQPQPHGMIRHAPADLKELHELVRPGHPDLLATLRSHLKSWPDTAVLRLPLILVISMPKQRTPGGPIETTDIWAFGCADTVLNIGVKIGCWAIENGNRAILLQEDLSKQGDAIKLDVLKPYESLSRDHAALLNGLDNADPRKVVVIGVGALGSQVVMNLARAGFGQWTVVDEDILLPHNTARHDLGGLDVGVEKAEAIAMRVRSLLNDSQAASAFNTNILRPDKEKPQLEKALIDAELILDMAATIPVSRHLAQDIASRARRISLFLNPQGTDLVMLAEDVARTVPLDVLEMQYYRAVANRPGLEGHLNVQVGRLRHGRSCRDVTSRVSQDFVAQHAGIGSRAIHKVMGTKGARILIWRVNGDDSSVRCVEVRVNRINTFRIGAWTMKVDEGLLKKMARLRDAKLPKETGGVLIGAFDLGRKIAYAIDTVPSPPDSQEWPAYYTRGSESLARRIQTIETRTAGNLGYVGEWHSHPDGCSCVPSHDDLKVFGWLTGLMDKDGLPAMMAIAGEQRHSAWFIASIDAAQDVHTVRKGKRPA